MEKEIEKIFIETLGKPKNINDLIIYIHFCLENKAEKNELIYCENHHILPQSKFKPLAKETKFQINLAYENHVTAHILLCKAYPIKSFIYPLHFMAKTKEEKQELIKLRSIFTKEWWEKIKEEKENNDIYKNWVEKRSNWMKENQKPGSEFLKKVCDGVQRFYDNHPERKIEVSKWVKSHWENLTEEEYTIRCNNMNWKESENYEERCKSIQKRYQDIEYALKHKNKMTEINKDPLKREEAGKVLKKLWQTESYVNNVTESRKKAKEQRKLQGIELTTSNTMKEKWKNQEWRTYNLEQRRKKREEKLNETH